MQDKTKNCMFQVKLRQDFIKEEKQPDVLYGPIQDHLLDKIFLAYMPNFIDNTKFNVVIFIVDPMNNLLRLYRINSQHIAVRAAMTDVEQVKKILVGANK